MQYFNVLIIDIGSASFDVKLKQKNYGKKIKTKNLGGKNYFIIFINTYLYKIKFLPFSAK
jgi:hypothetical protein